MKIGREGRKYREERRLDVEVEERDGGREEGRIDESSIIGIISYQ